MGQALIFLKIKVFLPFFLTKSKFHTLAFHFVCTWEPWFWKSVFDQHKELSFPYFVVVPRKIVISSGATTHFLKKKINLKFFPKIEFQTVGFLFFRSSKTCLFSIQPPISTIKSISFALILFISRKKKHLL